ncbi:MAG: SGNH/GDSL hydrolase family protein [Ferruginibacter sp.]|nr:SGNH/GDSL hydrolase family protein [Ferruginibacter sp.]
MKLFIRLSFFALLLLIGAVSSLKANGLPDSIHLFEADNPLFQYVGRIDFSNLKQPRFWSPGVYIKAKFKGTYCELLVNDQKLWGKNHNYIEIVLDNKPFRIQTKEKNNRLVIGQGLEDREHTLTICKNTESNIGWLEFAGLKCAALLPLPAKPVRKIEFIGNSITCGTGSDQSVIPCGKGVWQDQHNAYLSYGPTVARSLNAQWSLSAVSGIGLIHSCCGMNITMPPVFDKIDLRGDSLLWNFANYQSDVVTVCLGQNDGVQDSVKFCSAYLQFIDQLRIHYPAAQILLLTSPMGDKQLTAVLKNYLGGIKRAMNKKGDKNVDTYFYSKQYHNGCDNHPNLAEHQLMAKELGEFIKRKMKW